MRRVAVTGMGVVTPVGGDVGHFFAALLAAHSGVRWHEYAWGRALVAPVLDNADDAFSKMERMAFDRATQLALLAVRQAQEQAGVDWSGGAGEVAGVYWGTGMGGALTLENAYRELLVKQAPRLRPLTIVATMNNAAAGQIAIATHARGPSATFSCACSSSAVAIGEAFRAIAQGHADAAIAGGAEALLTQGVLKAWEAMNTLARPDAAAPQTSCRPFAADRSGFILGEGAGALVLEEWQAAKARGADVLAEIIGYGNSTDASHIAQPSADGQARALRLALKSAQIDACAIAHINAHGTGTQVGDVSETQAIKSAFGSHAPRIAISATKALTGHLMGAAGAVEFIAALEALRRGVAPPTAHLAHRDAQCDLDYVSDGPRKMEQLTHVMSSSFGFGGTNAVLIARR